MKLIISLLLTISLQAESYLILSGFAWHGKEANAKGRTYDKVIEGIGYQHRFDNVSFTTLGYMDSNSNPSIVSTVGYLYNINENLGIGLDVGLMAHNSVKSTDNKTSLDLVAFPKIEYLFDDYMINFIYTPRIKTNNLNVPEVAYISIGFEI